LDEILGLELGGDGYITKPFNPDVLLARVKAMLRRSQANAPSPDYPAPIQVGDLVIDLAAHTVTVGERPISLAAREFALLHALALQAGHVVSLDDLLAHVWGAEFAGEPQVVYVHVRWVREKIEENPNDPQRLITVRGMGYKLMAVNGEQ
jgi:DNA-binding response OmpR family regulator